MAHSPKPFFRTARDAWYVQLPAGQVKLAPGPKSAASEQTAWAAFHALMADRQRAPAPKSATPLPGGLTVAEVFEKYLGWCQANRAARTYAWTREHVQKFCDHLKLAPGTHPAALGADALRPFHVVEWVGTRPTWGPNQRRGATVAVTRPFAWAAKLGYLARNPVAGTEKPKATRREHHTTPAAFAGLLAHYPPGDPFRDYLEFLWETGCRPQEARQLEPRHYVPGKRLFALPPAEAKGKRRWRLIRLTARAAEVGEARLAAAPARVFENEDGHPWTADAVSCRFQRLKRAGKASEFAYALRHGFAERMLESGVDHLTVAELMGHTNGNMLATVYSHLGKADGHLHDALNGRPPGKARRRK